MSNVAYFGVSLMVVGSCLSAVVAVANMLRDDAPPRIELVCVEHGFSHYIKTYQRAARTLASVSQCLSL
jgi:hypothetical protein